MSLDQRTAPAAKLAFSVDPNPPRLVLVRGEWLTLAQADALLGYKGPRSDEREARTVHRKRGKARSHKGGFASH